MVSAPSEPQRRTPETGPRPSREPEPGSVALPATDGRPVDLDRVSAQWRVAFDAAHDALRAATLCSASLRFTPQELHERSARLTREREVTAKLVDAIAHEEHVHLLHRVSPARPSRRQLGLPADVRGCIFDLDGVLTASAVVHAAAWAETFDEFLARWAERTGERFSPIPRFTPRDYREHIHAKPRLEGIHAFLASRGIRIPEGHPDDLPGGQTVYALANRKNDSLLRHLDRDGVSAFEGSRRYLEAVHDADLRSAVVSASANTGTILERAGLASLVERRIDGNTIRSEHLHRKPSPDTLLAACRRLDILPRQAVTFETTLTGIAAGKEAGFGLVVGVDREGHAETLREHGADVVVNDLAALLDPALAA